MRHPEKKVLFLIVCSIYFDQMERGEKKIEYRQYTDYYRKRIDGAGHDTILLQNGYHKGARRIAFFIEKITIESVVHEFFKTPEPIKCFCIHLGDKLIINQ